MFSVAPVAPRLWWHDIYKNLQNFRGGFVRLWERNCKELLDFGRGFARICETLREDLQGLTRIHKSLEEDL